jgi:hypothetical protein
MAIVQVAFKNHINMLSRKKAPEVPVADLSVESESADATLARYAGGAESEAFFLWSLAKAPPELIRLLDLIAYDDSKYVRAPSTCGRYLRETNNEHFGRLAGYDPTGGNAVAYAEEYFA